MCVIKSLRNEIAGNANGVHDHWLFVIRKAISPESKHKTNSTALIHVFLLDVSISALTSLSCRLDSSTVKASA